MRNTQKMAHNDIKKSMRHSVFRVLMIALMVILVANSTNMFMVWLTSEVLDIKNRYLRSETQFLGTLLICLTILLVVFYLNFRRRKQELTTLSEHITQVAHGDFSTRITYNKKDPMAHVYKDFNKMANELSNLQFLRKDFINNYSHEFKTPIASIHGFASLLLEKELNKEQAATYLKIIQEESDRLSRLTSNTILLSKLSSQEIVYDTEEYDLTEQLRQCSILLSGQWMEKEQNYSVELEEVTYVGNRELLQHLFINIIANAIKYTPVGGEIHVSLEKTKEAAIITVKDSGIGMSEETKIHLFDPYYQSNHNKTNPGLGLGLSIAKQIVQLLEGTIEVESTLGEGSSFRIRLPF